MAASKRSTIIQVIIFLGIGIALIFWQYYAMDEKQRREMLDAMKAVRYIYFLPALVMGFFSHYFRALRWKLLLKPIDIKPTTANTLFSVLIGYLVNALIPRMGEVAKCTVLAKYENVPADKMVGTILAERAFDMLCFVIIFFMTLLLQYEIISPYAIELYHKIFFDKEGAFIWIRIVALIVFLLIALLGFIFVYRKIKHTKIGNITKRIGEGLKTILQVKEKWLFLLYTILIWSLYTGIAILGFYMMPGMSHLPWLAGLAVIAIGTIAIIITPGGLGAFPPIVATILLLYGIPTPLGKAYGWVNWSMQTVIVLILGLSSLIILPLYNRNRNAQQNRNHKE